MKNIYYEFCNDTQNEAIGAYVIARFIKAYIANSEDNKKPTIFDVFIIFPMIMNLEIRKHIISEDGKMKSRILSSIVSKFKEDPKIYGSLHHHIEKYKEYTLTSLIFALHLNFIKLEEIYLSTTDKDIPSHTHLSIIASDYLGKLFANRDLFNFISLMGVNI